MTKAHKITSQQPFLLRRKLTIESFSESQWEGFIHELNHHPCVDFAERRSNNQLWVTFDGTHWSTDELLEQINAHGGQIKARWWGRRKLA